VASPWTRLYERFDQIERFSRDRDEHAAAARELHAWAERATDAVMRSVQEVAAERAKQFADRTGGAVTVRYPARPPLVHASGAKLTFLELGLAGSALHVYSHRGAGDLPFFHLVVLSARAPGQRPRRMLSLPGCFAARLPDAGYELRRADGNRPAQRTDVDALVLRAFELLVEDVLRAAGSHPSALGANHSTG
jgi:hypothetical protein